jgi:hypothetical protein
MNMKRISIFTIVFAGLFLLNACQDEDWRPSPNINENIGAVTKISVNPDKNFFNALNPLASEEVEFTIDVDGFEVTEVSSVDIMLQFTEMNGVYNELEEVFEDSVYTAVKVGEVSSFPATFSISAADAAAALNVDVSFFKVGDGFDLTFPIHSADGRTFTVALNSDLCQQPAQPSFGGCNVRWTIACASDLGGTYDFSTTVIAAGAGGAAGNCSNPVTGTGTLTDLGGGKYDVSDATFGQYDCAWDDTPAVGVRLVDVCNKISLSGSDQYGLIYTFVIKDNDGTSLTIDWSNDFGDAGTTVLTRTDSKTWPSELSN